MARKRKRRSGVVEIGTGPARVKIYTVNRKDGYPMFSLYWREDGRRRTKHLACIDEARLIAQQVSVRLENGFATGTEATKRNLELLRHCEKVASGFGVSLTAAMDEWASARKTAGDEIPLSDAVRFYAANRSIMSDPSGAMGDTAVKAQIPGGWRQNALRHSFISYRVAETGDVARTSLEAGNSPKQVFRHYREVVDGAAAKAWFSITPPEGWQPSGLKWSIRERLRRNLPT